MDHCPSKSDEPNSLDRESIAGLIVSNFANRLLALAQDRLGKRLRSKVSPEDVVQSALRSFFRRFDEFTLDPGCPNELWGLLVVITLRKCSKWEDVFGASKRNVNRERSMTGDSHAGQSKFGLESNEPSPEDIAIFHELLERIMQPLNIRQREMIQLRLQGMEIEEIAVALQSSKRTVSRVIAMVKTILNDTFVDESSQ